MMWSRKFTSMATVKGYRGIITGKETPPYYLDKIDKSTTAEKATEKLRRSNKKGYSEFLFSVSDEVTFGIIDEGENFRATGWLPHYCLVKVGTEIPTED